MKLAFFFLIIIVFIAGCAKEPDPNRQSQVFITSIAPSSGSAGTTVVIKGANFGVDVKDNVVMFNKDSAAVVAASGDSLIVIAPAKGTSGPVSVSVGGSVATGPVFTYTADSVDVYVAAPAMGVVYWKNGKEVFLEPTEGNTGGAFGLAVSDTDVYVGSYTYSSLYPAFRAAVWKNRTKTFLSSPDRPGEVRAIALSGKDVYAGGREDDNPVYWKNGVRNVLPIAGRGYARVDGLSITGNDMYACGFKTGPNNEVYCVYWKNGVETVVGKTGFTSGINDLGVSSIAVNGSDVYVCATDSGGPGYWKNGVRIMLEKFPPYVTVESIAIAIAGSSVYVVGSYNGDPVYWKDGIRTALPKRALYASASAITFYQSDIYIGGRDGDIPVYWKNGVEVSLCCREYARVSAIVVVKQKR